jgi:protein TonB
MTEARLEPEPVRTPDIKLPELPQQETEEAVAAQPPTPPEEEKPAPRKREVEKKPADQKKPKAPRTTAPTPSASPRADRAAAPALGAASIPSVSQASWRSGLMAHLNRHKRFPPGAAGSGTASVLFTISRSGQVLSARLSRSSGDRVLDQEAIVLVRRASPVPAPPPDMGGGGSITLSVPVRFNR